MKKIRVIMLIAVCFLCFSIPVRAQETDLYESVHADALMEALPEEARSLLLEAGISPQNTEEGSAETLLEAFSAEIKEGITEPVRVLLQLLGIILLTRTVLEFAPQELRRTAEMCGTLGAAVLLLPQTTALITQTAHTTQALGAFLAAAVPVYAGIIMLSGSTAVGSSYGALTLAAANGVSVLSGQLFLPLVRVFTALATVSSVTAYNLQKLTETVYKCVKWTLTLAVSVFTGILSLQTLISAQADAVTGKAVKMMASSAIPIVGGAFGDAIAILSAGVSTVKSGIGAFGILAAAVILLPLGVKIGIWILIEEAAVFAAELFSLQAVSVFLNGCITAMKILLALLFSTGAAAMIAAAVLLCVRSAYG